MRGLSDREAARGSAGAVEALTHLEGSSHVSQEVSLRAKGEQNCLYRG